MTLDAQTIVQFVFTAVLLPALAGWWLSRRLSRAMTTLVVAIAGGLTATVLGGAETGLAAAACCAAVAYVASGQGFIPASLDEAGRLVKDSPRRWWR